MNSEYSAFPQSLLHKEGTLKRLILNPDKRSSRYESKTEKRQKECVCPAQEGLAVIRTTSGLLTPPANETP